MAEKSSIFDRIRGNAEWDLVKWCIQIGGSAIMPTFLTIYYKLRNIPLDWVAVGAMFLLGFALLSLAIWLTSRQKRLLTNQKLDERLAQAQEDTKAQVAAMLASYNKQQGENRASESVADNELNVVISPLQRDAVLLSMRLLGFIDAQGPPPAPKFTRAEIDRHVIGGNEATD